MILALRVILSRIAQRAHAGAGRVHAAAAALHLAVARWHERRAEGQRQLRRGEPAPPP